MNPNSVDVKCSYYNHYVCTYKYLYSFTIGTKLFLSFGQHSMCALASPHMCVCDLFSTPCLLPCLYGITSEQASVVTCHVVLIFPLFFMDNGYFYVNIVATRDVVHNSFSYSRRRTLYSHVNAFLRFCTSE